MTGEQLEQIIDATIESIRKLRQTKGRDYAHEADPLANFKRHAANLDLTAEQIWAVYASKHWDAIMAYCKRGQVESEPIDGRIDDALTYLLLLKGLIADRESRE